MIRILIVLLVLILGSCQEKNIKNASLTYKEAFFANEEVIASWAATPKWTGMISIDSGWEFLGIDSIVGLDRNLPDFESGQAVLLPHRVLAPNHSFWYRIKVDLEPGILILDADDGAQLWFNEERVPQSDQGEFFVLEEGIKGELTIRVLNNAMSGGLRKVEFVPMFTFLNERQKNLRLRDSALIIHKIELIRDPQLKRLIEEEDQVGKMELLSSRPILFSSPVLVMGKDGNWMVRWVSERPGKSILKKEDGTVEELFSEDGVFSLPISQSQVSFGLWQENSFLGHFEFKVPRIEDRLKVAIWGDSQGGWTTFHQLSKLISEHQADLSIGAGDLVNNGSEEFGYVRFLQSLSLMNTPQLPVPGNHDYDGYYEDLIPENLKRYVFQSESPTYGSYHFGPLAVLTLDPNSFFPVHLPEGSDQRKWAEKVLESESWNNAPWKMVVLHQPPYSQGWLGYQGELAIRSFLEPYFHEGKVDLVVSGHTHDYERLTLNFSDHPVHFLVVGGAGGGLEPKGKDSDFPKMDMLIKEHHFGLLELDSVSLWLKVYGIQGQILDQFEFKKVSKDERGD